MDKLGDSIHLSFYGKDGGGMKKAADHAPSASVEKNPDNEVRSIKSKPDTATGETERRSSLSKFESKGRRASNAPTNARRGSAVEEFTDENAELLRHMAAAKRSELARDKKGLTETLHSQLPSGGPAGTGGGGGGGHDSHELDVFREEMGDQLKELWDETNNRMVGIEVSMRSMQSDMNKSMALITNHLGISSNRAETTRNLSPLRKVGPPAPTRATPTLARGDTFKGPSSGYTS
jgi:hypothetical protein